MSLQVSWAIRGKTLSIQFTIRLGCTFIVSVQHPLMRFFWHLSQGSFKGLQHLQPLQIVQDSVPAENSSPTEKEEAKPELLVQVEEGLEYYPPERCEDGINGCYFLKDKNGKFIAVFKPKDEEGNSDNNPKRNKETSEDAFVNSGIPVGEGAIREVAAYKLDKGHFAGVPETFMATLNHPSFQSSEGIQIAKTGSLQAFVENDGASWDIGPSRFPVREVHKIGVLDMRILNNDRHGGNLLMRENFDNGNIELVPIDHGLSLPTTLNHVWFDWLSWPQAKQPFDEETKDYIKSINIEEDEKLLQEMGFKEEVITTMKISSTFLKKGAAAGLNLFDIGSMVCREEPDKPSTLEVMVEQANQDAQGDRLQNLWKIMDSSIIPKTC